MRGRGGRSGLGNGVECLLDELEGNLARALGPGDGDYAARHALLAVAYVDGATGHLAQLANGGAAAANDLPDVLVANADLGLALGPGGRGREAARTREAAVAGAHGARDTAGNAAREAATRTRSGHNGN